MQNKIVDIVKQIKEIRKERRNTIRKEMDTSDSNEIKIYKKEREFLWIREKLLINELDKLLEE